MSKQDGFTLIELMIVLAVIAMLATIALPSYSDYVTRSRFPEAQGALATGRVAAEQWFLDQRTYVGMPCPGESSNFRYDCSNPAPTSATYTITANGKDSMTGFAFTINELNARSTTVTGAPAAKGWQGNATCWTIRKTGDCS